MQMMRLLSQKHRNMLLDLCRLESFLTLDWRFPKNFISALSNRGVSKWPREWPSCGLSPSSSPSMTTACVDVTLCSTWCSTTPNWCSIIGCATVLMAACWWAARFAVFLSDASSSAAAEAN